MVFKALVEAIIKSKRNPDDIFALNTINTLKRELKNDLIQAYDLSRPLIEKNQTLFYESKSFLDFLLKLYELPITIDCKTDSSDLLNDYENQLKNCFQEKENLKRKLTDLLEENEKILKDFENFKLEHQNLTSELCRYKNESTALLQDVRFKLNDSSQFEKCSLENQLQMYTNKIKNLESTLQSKDEAIASLTKEICTCKTNKQAVDNKLNLLEEELKIKRTELNTFYIKSNTWEDTKSKFEAQIQKLNEEIENVKKSNQNLKQQLESYSKSQLKLVQSNKSKNILVENSSNIFQPVASNEINFPFYKYPQAFEQTISEDSTIEIKVPRLSNSTLSLNLPTPPANQLVLSQTKPVALSQFTSQPSTMQLTSSTTPLPQQPLCIQNINYDEEIKYLKNTNDTLVEKLETILNEYENFRKKSDLMIETQAKNIEKMKQNFSIAIKNKDAELKDCQEKQKKYYNLCSGTQRQTKSVDAQTDNEITTFLQTEYNNWDFSIIDEWEKNKSILEKVNEQCKKIEREADQVSVSPTNFADIVLSLLDKTPQNVSKLQNIANFLNLPNDDNLVENLKQLFKKYKNVVKKLDDDLNEMKIPDWLEKVSNINVLQESENTNRLDVLENKQTDMFESINEPDTSESINEQEMSEIINEQDMSEYLEEQDMSENLEEQDMSENVNEKEMTKNINEQKIYLTKKLDKTSRNLFYPNMNSRMLKQLIKNCKKLMEFFRINKEIDPYSFYKDIINSKFVQNSRKYESENQKFTWIHNSLKTYFNITEEVSFEKIFQNINSVFINFVKDFNVPQIDIKDRHLHTFDSHLNEYFSSIFQQYQQTAKIKFLYEQWLKEVNCDLNLQPEQFLEKLKEYKERNTIAILYKNWLQELNLDPNIEPEHFLQILKEKIKEYEGGIKITSYKYWLQELNLDPNIEPEQFLQKLKEKIKEYNEGIKITLLYKNWLQEFNFDLDTVPELFFETLKEKIKECNEGIKISSLYKNWLKELKFDSNLSPDEFHMKLQEYIREGRKRRLMLESAETVEKKYRLEDNFSAIEIQNIFLKLYKAYFTLKFNCLTDKLSYLQNIHIQFEQKYKILSTLKKKSRNNFIFDILMQYVMFDLASVIGKQETIFVAEVPKNDMLEKCMSHTEEYLEQLINARINIDKDNVDKMAH